ADRVRGPTARRLLRRTARLCEHEGPRPVLLAPGCPRVPPGTGMRAQGEHPAARCEAYPTGTLRGGGAVCPTAASPGASSRQTRCTGPWGLGAVTRLA